MLKSQNDLNRSVKDKDSLNKRAFKEWLEKKEQQILNGSLSLNSSRNKNEIKHFSNPTDGLPPFYPSSRTIPFGR